MVAQQVMYTGEPARVQPLEDRVGRLYTPQEAMARLEMNTHYLRCLASNGRIQDQEYMYTAASVERFRRELQGYVSQRQFVTEAAHRKHKLRMSKEEVRALVYRLRNDEPEMYKQYFVDILGPKRPSRYRGRSAIPPLWYIEQAKIPEAIAYLRSFSGEIAEPTRKPEKARKSRAASPAAPSPKIDVVDKQSTASLVTPAQPPQLSQAERILALRRAAERRREEEEERLGLERLAAEVAADEYGDRGDEVTGDE